MVTKNPTPPKMEVMYPEIGTILSKGRRARFQLRRSIRSSYGLILTSIGLLGTVVSILSKMEDFGLASRLLCALPALPLLELVRRYYNDIYVVSRDRVTHYAGRISLRFSVPSIRCIDLRAITVSQGLVGRIFNFGDVGLSTAAQDGAELVISGAVDPQELAKLIDELRQHSQQAIVDSGGSEVLANAGHGE